MFLVGTAHFPTRRAAIRYFSPYNNDDYMLTCADVTRRLIDREIYIGRPQTKARVVLIDGGLRYAIAEK